MTITNLLCVSNGKGGCGKSSTAASTAALAALAGLEVLALDLDPQGNLADDLGVDDHDGGANFFEACVLGRTPEPVRNVRERLDLITAGPATRDLQAVLWARGGPEAGAQLLEDAVAKLAGNYDLIVCDTPPSEGSRLVESVLRIAHWMVIPTRTDLGSLRGVARAAQSAAEARVDNPELTVLGILLFNVAVSDRQLLAEARNQLQEALPPEVKLFDTFIRNARRAADDTRGTGTLPHEYEAASVNAAKERLKALRQGHTPGRAPGSNAAGLAEDYQNLTAEILAAIDEDINRTTSPAPQPASVYQSDAQHHAGTSEEGVDV